MSVQIMFLHSSNNWELTAIFCQNQNRKIDWLHELKHYSRPSLWDDFNMISHCRFFLISALNDYIHTYFLTFWVNICWWWVIKFRNTHKPALYFLFFFLSSPLLFEARLIISLTTNHKVHFTKLMKQVTFSSTIF